MVNLSGESGSEDTGSVCSLIKRCELMDQFDPANSGEKQPVQRLLQAFMKQLSEISAFYQKSKETYKENWLSPKVHDRKDNGIYYTDVDLAMELAKISIRHFVERYGIGKLVKANFLEPCNGIGIFTFAYLTESQRLLENEYRTSWQEKLQEQIRHIYVADRDHEALMVYKALQIKFAALCGIEWNPETCEKNIWDQGLIYKIHPDGMEWIDFQRVKQHFQVAAFDIILTNPPYKKLKAEKQQYSDPAKFESAKQMYKELAARMRKNSHLRYAVEGTLNLYKLFTEAVLEEYTDSRGAIVGLLIPYNILTDLHCQKLRNRILEHHRLMEVITFKENNVFFKDSKQSLCYLLLEVGGRTTNVNFLCDVNGRADLFERERVTVPIHLLTKLTASKSIVPLQTLEKSILEKTLQHKTLEQYEKIHVLRGELDLTLGKKFIVAENKEGNCLPLLRGNALGREYLVTDKVPKEWVLYRKFNKKLQKDKFIKRERIACQQVVNMKKQKRINFVKIEPNRVLANSCNFLAVERDDLSLDALLGYMNSSFVDWRFKITSSNNHVNNYELLEIPLPEPHAFRRHYTNIENYVKKYMETTDKQYLSLIDSEVFQMYGFTSEEVLHIMTIQQCRPRFPHGLALKDAFIP